MVVYIAEAHALDGPMPNNRPGSPLIEEPETLEERLAVAGRCTVALSLAKIPALVDRLDNAALKSYAAFPDRLFLINKQGRISFAGDRGPSGFNPAELEDAIRKQLKADTDFRCDDELKADDDMIEESLLQ